MTGDKLETAINIALACNLIQSHMYVEAGLWRPIPGPMRICRFFYRYIISVNLLHASLKHTGCLKGTFLLVTYPPPPSNSNGPWTMVQDTPCR